MHKQISLHTKYAFSEGTILLDNNGPTRQSWHFRSQASSISMDNDDIKTKYASMFDQPQPSNPLAFADEKIRHLNERLLEANDLIKQHVKVAEEAVAGWEKAKSDCVCISHQLDVVLKEKKASDDIVSHLDAMLKECLQDLQHLQDKHEQNLDERTQDLENVRLELEEKLAYANRELAGSGYENARLKAIVREQEDTILKLQKSCSQAEAGVQKMQVCIETIEKQNSSLKYEVIMLNKEVGIHIHEREINRRSIEAANRQHLEDIKKINRLEAECQKLRGNSQKKFLSSESITTMKVQENHLDEEKSEFCPSSNNQQTHSSRGLGSLESMQPEPLVKTRSFFCSQRFPTIENEETLDNKTNELHESNLAFAHTTNKLTTFGRCVHTSLRRVKPLSINHVLDDFDFPSVLNNPNKESSQDSILENNNHHEESTNVADSWVPMRYLKDLHKLSSDSPKASGFFDSVDDFIEMERWATFSSDLQEGRHEDHSFQHITSVMDELRDHVFELSKAITPRDSLGTSLVEEMEVDPHQGCLLSSKDNPRDKISEMGSGVKSVVCGLIHLVECLALEVMAQYGLVGTFKEGSSTTISPNCSPSNEDSPSAFNLSSSMKHFMLVANQFLDGQVEVEQFIGELSYALEKIKKFNSNKNPSLTKQVKQTLDQDELSDLDGLFSKSSNSDGFEHLRVLRSSDEAGVHSPEPLMNDGPVNVGAEKVTLDSKMREEFSTLERMLFEAKQEKGKLQNMLVQEKEKLKYFTIRLSDAEQLITNLRIKLAFVEFSRDVASKKLTSTTTTNAKLISQLKECRSESDLSIGRMKCLEETVDIQRARNKELQLKVEELQESLLRFSSGNFQTEVDFVGAKNDKEQNINDATLNLEEYDHTILSLERKLKKIGFDKRASPSNNIQQIARRSKSDVGMVDEHVDCDIFVVTDDEVVPRGNVTSKNTCDEQCVEKVGDLIHGIGRSSDTLTDTKPVKSVDKLKKNSRFLSSMDLTKSLTLGSSSKHGSSLNRLFSRPKKT